VVGRRWEELAEKVSVHWVHVKNTKTLASGRKRRYLGKRRFKMYIRHEDEYFETKYVGLGTFLYYNKRFWLLPLERTRLRAVDPHHCTHPKLIPMWKYRRFPGKLLCKCLLCGREMVAPESKKNLASGAGIGGMVCGIWFDG
jgi:hypothetical protein